MRIKFNYHSMVDVITNSSTTIYTDSSNCIGPAKELVAEFCKAMGVETKVDEMFGFGVFYSNYSYTDYDFECECEGDTCSCDNPFEGMNWEERSSAWEVMMEQIGRGEIKKPKWVKKVEERFDDYEYSADSELYIFPKDEKYEALGKALIKFLYSTDHEEGNNS